MELDDCLFAYKQTSVIEKFLLNTFLFKVTDFNDECLNSDLEHGFKPPETMENLFSDLNPLF